jgi:hypothetical protein
MAAPAVAAPITGSINIGGIFRGTDAAGNNVRLSDAVAIDFCNNVTGTDCGSTSTTGTGTFLVRPGGEAMIGPMFTGDTGTIKDFNFASFSAPITNFLSVNGLTFDLQSIVANTFTVPGSGRPGTSATDYLFLTGAGVFRLAGYDATPGTFTFSGQSNGISLLGTFSFSGGAAALPVAVPVPAAFTLLGVGLVGLTLLRRRPSA